MQDSTRPVSARTGDLRALYVPSQLLPQQECSSRWAYRPPPSVPGRTTSGTRPPLTYEGVHPREDELQVT